MLEYDQARGAELAALGWPLPTSYDTANVTVVLATAAAGLGASAHVGVTGSRALRMLLRSARRPVPLAVLNAAGRLMSPPG